MFVIMSSLRKFSGDRRLSDSDMPPAKAQRRQVRKRCHFDPFGQAQGKLREKTFLDPSHSLGLMGMGSSPLRLGAFAGDNSAFGCAVRRQANLFSPAQSGEKRVLLCFKICAPRANLMTTQNISDSEIPPAKARRAPSSDNYFLCGLCVFAGDNLILVALRHARSCVVHTSSQETQNNPKIKGVERKDLRHVQAWFGIHEDWGLRLPSGRSPSITFSLFPSA